MPIACRRHALLVLAVLAAMPFAGSCQAADAAVTIDNFAFNPPRLTIKAGTTVTWRNSEDTPHNIVSNPLKFRSRTLDTGDSFSFTFAAPGVYEYFCSLHPHMTGIIVVEGATGGGATP